MIDEIFVALRHSLNQSDAEHSDERLSEAIGFAKAKGLNIELTGVAVPQVLDNPEARGELVGKINGLLGEDFKGKLSLYAAMTDLNPVSEDLLIARASRGRYVQTVELAKALNARYLIVPSQYMTLVHAENRANKWLSDTTKFWEQLIARSIEGSNLTVMLHNTMGDSPEYVKTIVSRVEAPGLRAGFSVGHANIFSQMAPNDWVDNLGNMLGYVQVCNNDGQTLSFNGFENGQIDLESFLNHLALLTQAVHLSIQAETVEDLENNWTLLQPFLQMQEETFTSKSFLV